MAYFLSSELNLQAPLIEQKEVNSYLSQESLIFREQLFKFHENKGEHIGPVKILNV